MTSELYSVLAYGARYVFVALLALFLISSWFNLRRENSATKRARKTAPHVGTVGQLVVLEGAGVFARGDLIPIPPEGFIGAARICDVCVPLPDVKAKHIFYRFEEGSGLWCRPIGRNSFELDDEIIVDRKGSYILHGSIIKIGAGLFQAAFLKSADVPDVAAASPFRPLPDVYASADDDDDGEDETAVAAQYPSPDIYPYGRLSQDESYRTLTHITPLYGVNTEPPFMQGDGAYNYAPIPQPMQPQPYENVPPVSQMYSDDYSEEYPQEDDETEAEIFATWNDSGAPQYTRPQPKPIYVPPQDEETDEAQPLRRRRRQE